MRQQTVTLRGQLTRMEQQIHSKTSAINTVFSDAPIVSPTIHATTLPNLRRSVEGARNALATLREKIDALEADDAVFAIDELEEELKFAFCESRRLSLGLQEKKAAVARLAQALVAAEATASPRQMADVRVMIKTLREDNAGLRAKSKSYRLKIERLNIEDEIADWQRSARLQAAVVAQANEELAELTAHAENVEGEMERDAAEHTQRIELLQGVIQEMREKIAARLGKEEY
jgi:hypothetical protein